REPAAPGRRSGGPADRGPAAHRQRALSLTRRTSPSPLSPRPGAAVPAVAPVLGDPVTSLEPALSVQLVHPDDPLAAPLFAELDARAAARGYSRMYLTTGPRQPEAKALYLAAGWSPLFDPARPRPTDLESLRALPPAERHYAFEKDLA